jgi:hypothetical protein
MGAIRELRRQPRDAHRRTIYAREPARRSLPVKIQGERYTRRLRSIISRPEVSLRFWYWCFGFVIALGFGLPIQRLDAPPIAQSSQEAVRQKRTRHWESSVSLCGLSFQAPSDWIASRQDRLSSEKLCVVDLKSKNYNTLVGRDYPNHSWTIAIEVYQKSFEELADDEDIIREGDRWFVGGGAFEQPAYEIKGPNWWGLRVDHFPMRSSTRANGSVQSEAVWMILSSTASKQAARVTAGPGADDGPLAMLLSSVRFETKQ